MITGAGSGFGRATATRFAREGAWGLGADVNEAAARETAEMVRGGGWEALLGGWAGGQGGGLVVAAGAGGAATRCPTGRS